MTHRWFSQRKNPSTTLSLLLLSIVYVSAQTTPTVIVQSVPPYIGQDLPLPSELIPYTRRFGCGFTVTQSNNNILAVGIDTRQLRLFLIRYAPTAQPDGSFRHEPAGSIFYGDYLDPQFIAQPEWNAAYSPNASCPICASQTGDWVAFGGWFSGEFPTSFTPGVPSPQNRTVVIARQFGDTYQFSQRLYVEGFSDQQILGRDMVCTAGLSQIFISAPSMENSTYGSQVKVFKKVDTSNDVNGGGGELPEWVTTEWVPDTNFNITYPPPQSSPYYLPTLPAPTLNLGLSEDGLKLAVASSSQIVDLFSIINGTLLQRLDVSNVTTNNTSIVTVGLDFFGKKLVFSKQGPIFPGQRYVYVVEPSNNTTPLLDPKTALSLIYYTDNTSAPGGYSSWGFGSSISFSPGGPKSTSPPQMLALGMPSYPVKPTPSPVLLQTGALSLWLPCPMPVPNSGLTQNYTHWQPDTTFLQPFAPGWTMNDALGASETPHRVWSGDNTFLVGSSPLGSSTGAVHIFRFTIPSCPVFPPPPTPPSPPAPVSPPVLPGWAIALIVVSSLIVLGILIGLIACILSSE